MVDLGLFFRQFKVEVPRAHWSGGRAAGMCGCVEPTSGILVSGGRRAHQFPFSWRHIHHALPNNSSKDRQSFSDGHSLRCVQLPGPLSMPGRETACVPKTSILGCRPTAPQPYRAPIASRRGINQVRQKTRRKPAKNKIPANPPEASRLMASQSPSFELIKLQISSFKPHTRVPTPPHPTSPLRPRARAPRGRVSPIPPLGLRTWSFRQGYWFRPGDPTSKGARRAKDPGIRGRRGRPVLRCCVNRTDKCRRRRLRPRSG